MRTYIGAREEEPLQDENQTTSTETLPMSSEKQTSTNVSHRPGKPKKEDGIKGFHTIKLSWEPPPSKYNPFWYQIRYKTYDTPWIVYPDQPTEPEITLEDLKPGTSYVFQVCMVSDNVKSLYSDSSSAIATEETAATLYQDQFNETRRIKDGTLLRRVRLNEVITENTNSLTRKEFHLDRASDQNDILDNFEDKIRVALEIQLGVSIEIDENKKSVLLVAASNTEKNAFINGFLTYAMGVQWIDDLRLAVVDPDEPQPSEPGCITSYTFHPIRGSRLDYTVTLIDTPSIILNDESSTQSLVTQLKEILATKNDPQAVNAVCFLVTAIDETLEQKQIDVFSEVMSLLGTNAESNTLALAMAPDFKRPVVLKALDACKLTPKVYFPFNLSSLYLVRNGTAGTIVSPKYWDIGMACFQSFVDKLRNMTRVRPPHVQRTDPECEADMVTLREKIIFLLNKLFELKIDLSKIAEKKDTNISFKFLKLITCEKQPPKQPLPYKILCVERHEKVTNTSIVNRYRKGSEGNVSVEIVLERIKQDNIQKLREIRNCHTRLRKLSGRKDELTLHQLVDLVMESEKRQKLHGFEGRIKSWLEIKEEI